MFNSGYNQEKRYNIISLYYDDDNEGDSTSSTFANIQICTTESQDFFL